MNNSPEKQPENRERVRENDSPALTLFLRVGSKFLRSLILFLWLLLFIVDPNANHPVVEPGLELFAQLFFWLFDGFCCLLLPSDDNHVGVDDSHYVSAKNFHIKATASGTAILVDFELFTRSLPQSFVRYCECWYPHPSFPTPSTEKSPS